MTELPPGELFRLCAEAPTSAAWVEFLRRYEKLIAITAHRVARHWMPNPTPDDVADLVQNTLLKVVEVGPRALRRFELRTPEADFGFIKVFTIHSTIDHFKKLGTQKRTARLEPLDDALQIADCCESGESIERNMLIRQIDDLLRTKLSTENCERDILVFWLYYRSGLTAQAIADRSPIDLTTKGVESLLHRLTRLIRANFRY